VSPVARPSTEASAALAVIEHARAGLRSVPGLGPHHEAIALAFADGIMTVEGEVGDVAAKKLALECIAALPQVAGVVDRLRVKPAQPMRDKEIRDHLRNALLQEPAFSDLALREVVKGQVLAVREPVGGAGGTITIEVEDGVAVLNGSVRGLAHKRLAGVLAWWVPGSRDVINGIAVDPPEEDSDGEITEAVRVALEKDPFVDAGQIRVATANSVVTLVGLVPSDAEREMAEFDAWYVFGVDRVVNRIDVRR